MDSLSARESILHDREVPLCIRVRKNTMVQAGSGTWGPALWLFKDLPVMTETHGTVCALSKECRVFGQEGLQLVATRLVSCAGKAEYFSRWRLSGRVWLGRDARSGRARYGAKTMDAWRRLSFGTARTIFADCCSSRVPRRRPSSTVSGSYESLGRFCRVNSDV